MKILALPKQKQLIDYCDKWEQNGQDFFIHLRGGLQRDMVVFTIRPYSLDGSKAVVSWHKDVEQAELTDNTMLHIMSLITNMGYNPYINNGGLLRIGEDGVWRSIFTTFFPEMMEKPVVRLWVAACLRKKKWQYYLKRKEIHDLTVDSFLGMYKFVPIYANGNGYYCSPSKGDWLFAKTNSQMIDMLEKRNCPVLNVYEDQQQAKNAIIDKFISGSKEFDNGN